MPDKTDRIDESPVRSKRKANERKIRCKESRVKEVKGKLNQWFRSAREVLWIWELIHKA